MMNSYVLSVLGIVIAGILIDIIIPSGTLNKYIKSIYSIFVVAILISPLTTLIAKGKNFSLNYTDYQADKQLVEYIHTEKIRSLEKAIVNYLKTEGFKNVDININFSIEDYNLIYNSCEVNLKNLVITADKQHINKYEFIVEAVKGYTNLTDEEIIINEWQREKNRL